MYQPIVLSLCDTFFSLYLSLSLSQPFKQKFHYITYTRTLNCRIRMMAKRKVTNNDSNDYDNDVLKMMAGKITVLYFFFFSKVQGDKYTVFFLFSSRIKRINFLFQQKFLRLMKIWNRVTIIKFFFFFLGAKVNKHIHVILFYFYVVCVYVYVRIWKEATAIIFFLLFLVFYYSIRPQ